MPATSYHCVLSEPVAKFRKEILKWVITRNTECHELRGCCAAVPCSCSSAHICRFCCSVQLFVCPHLSVLLFRAAVHLPTSVGSAVPCSCSSAHICRSYCSVQLFICPHLSVSEANCFVTTSAFNTLSLKRPTRFTYRMPG